MSQKIRSSPHIRDIAPLLVIIAIGAVHIGVSMAWFIRRFGFGFDWKIYEAAARLGATTGNAYTALQGYHFVYPPIVLKLFVFLGPALPLFLAAAYLASAAALATRRMYPLAQGLLIFSGLTPLIQSRFAAAIIFSNISIFLHLMIIFCWLSSARGRTRIPFWLAVGGASLIKPYFMAYLIVPFIVFGWSANDLRRATYVTIAVSVAWGLQFLFWREQFDAFLNSLHSQAFSGVSNVWTENIGHGFLHYFAELTGELESALTLHVALSICLVAAAFMMGREWRRRNVPAESISLVALALAILINPRLKNYDDSVYCGLISAFLLFAMPSSVRVLRNWLVALAAVALCAATVIVQHILHRDWAFDAEIGISNLAPMVILVILEIRLVRMTRGSGPTPPPMPA